MRRTCLVTGGAGFIGSHLVEAVLRDGHRVIALDDLSAGRLQNLDTVYGNPNLRFQEGSILDEPLVDELVRECEVVVHLAAAVGVKLVVEQPLRCFTTNIRGSQNVIAAAYRHRRRLLLTSTSEIYGKNVTVPLPESADQVLGPPSVQRWAYSTAKALDEILAYAYHRENGFPVTVVRLFNTAGPRQIPDHGMVIPNFVRQALAGEPLTVHGDGRQSRCFCHVVDVVRALRLLLSEPAAVGEVFNVGSQEEVAILDLAQRVVERTASTSPIRLVPYEEAYAPGFEDMRRRVPDITKIHSLTGWSPTHTLEDILDDVIADAKLMRSSSRAEAEPWRVGSRPFPPRSG